MRLILTVEGLRVDPAENLIRACADLTMRYLRVGVFDLVELLDGWLVGLFRAYAAREAEIAFLRQQLLVLKSGPRQRGLGYARQID
jgi:hypothetical protein